jgi:hypothetical protein
MKTLIAARQAARQGFEKDKHLPVDSEDAAKQIHYVQDVARVLRENVVQGAASASDPSRLSMCHRLASIHVLHH